MRVRSTVGITILVLVGGLLVAACAPAAPTAATTPIPTAPARAAAATPTGASKPNPTPAPPTPTPKPDKVVLALPSAGGISDLPNIVALRKGFWQEEGFDVDKQVVRSEVAVKGVIGGEIEYTTSLTSALRAATQGLGIKGVLVTESRPNFFLVARPDIRTIQELKGKAIGINGVQTLSHVVLQDMLKHFGMDPEKDVIPTALPESSTRLKSLQGGAVQAAMLDVVFAVEAESQGMRILARAGELFERIQGGLATSDKLIKEKPEMVQRFVRATVKAMKYTQDPRNRDEIIQLMAEQINLPKANATKAYDLHMKNFSTDGDVSEALVKLEIDDAKVASQITKDVPVSQVFDYTFVRKLKQ